MRFKRFTPRPQDARRLGLGPLDMPKLGHVVVLAGPNGAGKTRILSLVESALDAMSNTRSIDEARRSIQTCKRVLAESESKTDKRDFKRSLRRYERNLYWAENRENPECVSLRSGPIQFAKVSTGTRTARPARGTWPRPIDPDESWRDLSLTEIDKALEMVGRGIGSDHIWVSDAGILHIKRIVDREFNATHQRSGIGSDVARNAAREKERLDEIVESFLAGAKIDRDIDGDLRCNGRPVRREELSAGQWTLLLLAALLHSQQPRLSEAILLIDEPEVYLHPDAQIEFVDRLIKATPNGQLWIATHSIHILSHVDPDSIWFVEAGEARWAGREPEIVLKRLVGDDERIGRLERFLRLPSVHAMQRFTAECLLPPTIASTGADDPQSSQIRGILDALRTRSFKMLGKRPLRVLDYGAGRGRILAALRESPDVHEHLDYHAFEPHAADAREECAATIADVYGISSDEARRRVYASKDDIESHLNPNSTHAVIMCNVLHEIPPKDWWILFSRTLSRCLHRDGYLLVVEDMHIPHGEHAHEHGFILLDTVQLQILFRATPEDPEHIRCYSERDRLKAHLISASLLGNVTLDTVSAALDHRVRSAKEVIAKLRSQASPTPFKNGQQLALYAMLHANAALALDELGGPPRS